MKINKISNQNFQGRVIGCSHLKPKQKEVFRQVIPCLENMIKDKNYDLFINLSYGNELRISTGKIPAYSVIDSNSPAIWIDRAKNIIKFTENNI